MNTEEKKKEALGLIDKVKAMFLSEKKKFEEVTTEDGTVLFYDGELAEGVEIFVVVEDEQVLAAEGTFVLENGTEVTVDTEGKVVSIAEVEAAEEGEEEQEEMFSQSQVNEMLEALRAELSDKFEAEKAEAVKTSEESLKEDFETALKEAEKEVNTMFENMTQEQPKKKKVELGILNSKQRAIFKGLPKKK